MSSVPPYREQQTIPSCSVSASSAASTDQTTLVPAVSARLWRISVQPRHQHSRTDSARPQQPDVVSDTEMNEIARLRLLLLTCEQQRIARLETQIADLWARVHEHSHEPLPVFDTNQSELPETTDRLETPEMTRLRRLVFAPERQRLTHLAAQAEALHTYFDTHAVAAAPFAAAVEQARQTIPPFDDGNATGTAPEVAQLRMLLLSAYHHQIIHLEAQIAVLRERFDALDTYPTEHGAESAPAPQPERPRSHHPPALQPAPTSALSVVVDTHLLASLLERCILLRDTVPVTSRTARHEGAILTFTLAQPFQLAQSTAQPIVPAVADTPPPPLPEPAAPHDEAPVNEAPMTEAAPEGNDNGALHPHEPDEPSTTSQPHRTNGYQHISGELERLRMLLLEPERQRIAELEAQIAVVRQQVDDSDIDYEELYSSQMQAEGLSNAPYADIGTAWQPQENHTIPNPVDLERAALPGQYAMSEEIGNTVDTTATVQDNTALLVSLLEQHLPPPGAMLLDARESGPFIIYDDEHSDDLSLLDSDPAMAQLHEPDGVVNDLLTATLSNKAPAQPDAESELSMWNQHDAGTPMSITERATPQPISSAPPANGRSARLAVREPHKAGQQRLVMRVAQLEAAAADLRKQLDDSEALIAMVAPVISLIIAERVRNSRDEMAEALYPIIGKTIGKAVTEALRELARRVDSTVRTNMDMKHLVKRWGLRLRGVNPQDQALRSLLPFHVQEIFLVHKDSGLLIHHLSNTNTLTDADLISGMLTAIRSYVKDSFAYEDGSLDEITYGDFRILMEEGTSAILAIVIQGNEPGGFQSRMRMQLTELHLAHGSVLRNFTGDPVDEQDILPFLNPLLESPDATA